MPSSYFESRAHLQSPKKCPAIPPRALEAKRGLELLGVNVQQLLSAVYDQGLQLAVLLHFHPFLAVLDNSLGGGFLAINDFGGSGHGLEVTHPTATTTRRGEGREAPIAQRSEGMKSCIERRKPTEGWELSEGGEKGRGRSAPASPTSQNVIKRVSEQVERKWVPAAKKLPEDLDRVAEGKDTLEGVLEGPGAAAAAAGLHARLAVAVVDGSLLGVRQHLVRLGHLFEPPLRLLLVLRVFVRVPPERQLAVGLLDGVGGGLAGHAQHLVVVHHVGRPATAHGPRATGHGPNRQRRRLVSQGASPVPSEAVRPGGVPLVT